MLFDIKSTNHPRSIVLKLFVAVSFAFTLTTSIPAGSGPSSCAAGGYKRSSGSGTCSCIGTIFYCVGISNKCHSKYSSGSLGCNNGVFGDPQYKGRKYCYCKPAGCKAGQKGPAGSCTSCSAGQYQPSNTWTGTSCHACPSGWKGPSTGGSACTVCTTGQYQASTGSSSCKNCPTGKYQDQNTQTGCKNCGSGRYQNSKGRSTCAACPSGQYQNQGGQAGCKSCPAGQYSDQSGQSGCKSCPTGQYKGSASNGGCTHCPVGKWMSQTGASSCINCARGTYQDQTGKTGCKVCPQGQYESRLGSSSCQGACTCGYWCPAGSVNSQAEDCGQGYYCPRGAPKKLPLGSNMGDPAVDNLLLATNFCKIVGCPSTKICQNGVAYPKFDWKTPLDCKNGLIYQTTMTEYVTGVNNANPPQELGEIFQTEPMSLWNTNIYKVVFSMSRIPAGCSKGRDDNGQPGTVSWLEMVNKAGTPSSTISSGFTAKLHNKDKKASAEDCSSSYAAVVSAELKRASDGSCAFNGGTCPTLTCHVAVSVSDENERPVIIQSSLTGKEVEEDKPPGTEIGTPLKANDPEVKAELQQLTWEITECKAQRYPAGSNSYTTLTAKPGSDLATQCPIKISACDGQLSIAAGAALNYESQVSYALKVKATDDGGGCKISPSNTLTPCSSTIQNVNVVVIPKNDPPTMEDPQVFYIQENTDLNSVWVDYRSKNSDNTGKAKCTTWPTNSHCGVLANDPDSNTLNFVQAVSNDPFVIGPGGIQVGNGADGVSRNFYGKIKFVPNSRISELDYESPNKKFTLQTYAKDDGNARSEGQVDVVIHLLDANDRPYLTGDSCQGNPDQLCIDIFENRAYKMNLRTNTSDQDIKSAWECCDSTDPYTFAADPRNGNGCDMSKYTEWKAPGFDGTTATSAGFQVSVNTIDYETDTNGCDMQITIKDKFGLNSKPQYVHINVEDDNDNPTNTRLKGLCSVDENTAQDETLPGNCIVIADDEDLPKQALTYHRADPPAFGGTTGADFTNWGNSKYFNIKSSTGNIVVDIVPNFESASVVTFKVTASDSKQGGSAAATVSVTVNDLNEAPMFSDDMLCQTPLAGTIVGGSSNLVCTKGLSVQEEQTTALSVTLTAYDPDKNTVTANRGNAQLKFEMQTGYEKSDLFTVATSGPVTPSGVVAPAGTYTGTLTPATNAILDYETMYTDEGLKIGIKVYDNLGVGASALSVDCDMSISMVDINEPPFIDDFPSNGSPNKLGYCATNTCTSGDDNPMILSCTNVKVGDKVGPTLLVKDPDVGNPATPNSKGLDDRAVCVKVASPDWDFFEIDSGCQIYVKKIKDAAKNVDLNSPGAIYLLKVKAVDQGRSFINNAITPLSSGTYTYYIKGTANLNSPIFNIFPTGSTEPFQFKIKEGLVGTISQGTHQVNGQANRNDLYKACTDENVPGRKIDITDVATCKNDCSSYINKDACNGKTPSTTTVTHCQWSTQNTCVCRDQGLRYKIVETVPNKGGALVNPFTVDKNSATLTLSAKADYEKLFGIDGEIKCTVGQPDPYCTGTTPNICDFWPKYMNGVKGVCRAYNNDRKKANNALDKMGYLDGAHLCAERGARLATLAQLQAAYADSTAQFRTPNLLDLWDYPTTYDLTNPNGGGASNPSKQNGPNKEKFPADTNAMRVWTYSGKVAQITDASGVTEVDQSSAAIDQRTPFPVLCYVGEKFENEDLVLSSVKKANQPILGYSIRLRCLDTAEKTFDEKLLEYYPQSQIDDRFVFVRVEDIQEDPYFDTPELDGITIPENIADATLVIAGVNANDNDKGDAKGLVFSIPATEPFTTTDQPENQIDFRMTSRTTTIKTDLSKIPAGHFDFEIKGTWTFTLTVRDTNGNSGTQLVTVEISDVNEPPVLRVPSNPKTASPDAGNNVFYKTYDMKEDAATNHVLGTVMAWDPDGTTTLKFELDGTGDNRAADGSPIFITSQSKLLSDSASYDKYGHITTSNLTLSENSEIDFETKQTYIIRMTATDGSLTDTIDIKIRILNVNDLEITSVQSASPTLATAGNEQVTIIGKNFGVKWGANGLTSQKPTVTVRYGRVEFDRTGPFWMTADCTVDGASGTTNTQLNCKSSEGFGANHVWQVQVVTQTNGPGIEGDATSDASQTTSYSVPVITNIAVDTTVTPSPAFDKEHLPTKGEHYLVLTGTNMGPKNTVLQGYYGTSSDSVYTAKNCIVTVQNTEVKCYTIEGIGFSHTWKLGRKNHEWNGKMSASDVITSYDSPTLTSVAVGSANGGKVMSTWGRENIVIVGENFGPAFDRSSTTTPSNPGNLTLEWNNNDAITCTGNQHCYGYAQPLSCTVSIAHEQLTCVSLPGVGMSHRFTVTVAGQSSNQSPANDRLRYHVPVISGIKGPGAYEADTHGGVSFYIEGNYFGPNTKPGGSGTDCAVKICGHADANGDGIFFQAQTDAGVLTGHRFKGLKCTVLKNQIYIKCTSPVGVGKNLAYTLQIGGQTSVLMKQLKNSFGQRPSYGAPVVSQINLMKQEIPQTYANTRGYTTLKSGKTVSETVVITGQNFGPVNTGQCKIGFPNKRPCQVNSDCSADEGAVCEAIPGSETWNPTTGLYQTKDKKDVYHSSLCVVTVAHKEMQCDVIPGAGHTHEWTVTVGRQDSTTPTSSYHRPILDSITGIGASDGKTNGQQIVVLHGSNFGPYSKPAAVSYGVTGEEYKPTGCVIQSHEMMTCTTVPGIGKNLYWRVRVRDQTNILKATTSYSPPYIHSVTPNSASADGSKERGYIVYLNVSNSGLADPVTRRIIKFDTYEIPAEPDGASLTRREGDYDIIAFSVPKLYNRKKAVDIEIRLIVFPYDKETGRPMRSSQIESSNFVVWKYDSPFISQVSVLDHPTNSDQRIVRLIGKNFGHIANGPPLVEEVYKMEVMDVNSNNVSVKAWPQQLNQTIPHGPKITFIQDWEQGAERGRFDRITVIYLGSSGSLRIKRGGEASNIVHFKDLTPKIQDVTYWNIGSSRNQIYKLPTLGSTSNGEGGQETIQVDIKCSQCGSKTLKCIPQRGTCPVPSDTSCDCTSIPNGIPRDVKIWFGSVKLLKRHLRPCPIVPGSAVLSLSGEWTFTCEVPAYQGSEVDTRVQYNGMWSDPTTSVYRPPVISYLSRSVGGTKGASDFSRENYRTTSTKSYLEIPTNGDKIKLTGRDFGQDYHGDITGYNTKYVSLDGIKYRPTCVNPPHGGLTIDVPPGTGGRMRKVQVTTGQFQFDVQNSNTIDVKYFKPTVVDHLVPLWKVDENGTAGGYEIRIFGYDFSTTATQLNRTIVSFKGTPCEVTFTSYNMIKCKIGSITSTSGNPATRITVDGQSTDVYVTNERKKSAKDAVAAGQTTRDDELINERVNFRDTQFRAQIDKCVGSTYGADGLSTAMQATKKISNQTLEADRTEQQRVIVKKASSLTESEKERVHCIAVVQEAFAKKCNSIFLKEQLETDESKAILEAAYVYDETTVGKTPSRGTKCWWDQTPDGPSSVTGPTGGDVSVSSGGPDDYAGRPMITSICPLKGVDCDSSVNMKQLPTKGGINLLIEAFNLDKESTKAVLVDDTGKNPDVWINNNKTLPPSSFIFDGVRWNVRLTLPPGQGKIMRLQFISDRLGLASVRSGQDVIGFAPPKFQADYSTTNILSSPTDSCKRNQFESELLWAARIDGVGKKKRLENPGKYRRKCLQHFALKIKGDNFGENTKALKVWVKGTNMMPINKDTSTGSNTPPPIIFPVFNGSLYQTTDTNNRGFAGCSTTFCFEHKHDELTVMGPEGYGRDCELWISVAGQEAKIPFNFQPPEADYSEPNPYDASGESITIHGQNFGGVASPATVFIDNEECKAKGEDHAIWLPEHPVKGLPYISCVARDTMAGIVNISVFVAGQQSRIIQVESISRAGVRSICKPSTKEKDLDLKTGQPKEFWGRIEPARELCTPCPEGSGCNDDSYDPPFSVANFFIQELDISGGRNSLFTSENDPVTRRERRDYKRATEQQNVKARVCPPERLLDPVLDAALYKRFEAAVMNKRDFCLTVLPCKPAQSCIGKNQCAEKYEGNLLRCKRARSDTPNSKSDDPLGNPIIQHCNQTLQCQSKSLGQQCVNSLTSVCNCPAAWAFGKSYNRKTGLDANINNPSPVSTWSSKSATGTSWQEYENDRYSSHECLKSCVRDETKMSLLIEQGCEESYLQARLGGYYPDYFHPEDSATCVPKGHCVNATGIKGPKCLADVDCDDGTCEIFGECECIASPRCVECTAGTHYRRDGKCEECPKNMILVFVGFFFGIIILLVSMYFLDKQDFNLAFISIPIDYFQVLALFSRADIRWPPALLEILYALRFFNFNIDVATPECLLVGIFTYEHKFFGTLLLLPIAVIGLLIIWGFHCCWSKGIMNKSIDKLYSSKLVGTFLLSVYFLFLSCTTRALEIFNCSPTDPDDGWTYTDFTDRKCDGGGLCRCNDPEHLPFQLIPYAVIALLVYTIGFPAVLVWILRFGGRKNLIKEDQILRAAGVGDSLSTNSRAYYIRVKYHKMYYYFKPGKTYWLLYILIRKAGIATCGLIFRTNPGFMLAGVLLILFICYMVQVKHQPYMSTSQRALVLAEHKIKAAGGDHLHQGIAMSIQKALLGEGNSRDYQKARLAKLQFTNSSLTHTDTRDITRFKRKSKLTVKEKAQYNSAKLKNKARRKDAKAKARAFFFDYNTVEQVLLACAILVCLAGVMFESDRFQATDASGKLRYGWMRDMVTFCIVAVVIGSLFYLVLVTLSEVIGYTPKCLQKIFAEKKNHALLSAAETIQDNEDNQIEMQFVNPAASAAQVADHAQLKELQEKLSEQEKVNAELTEARRKNKLNNTRRGGKKKNTIKKGKMRKKKNEFGAKHVTLGDDDIHAEAPNKMDDIELMINASASEVSSKIWKAVNDPNTGGTYYHNVVDNSVTWTKPSDDQIL